VLQNHHVPDDPLDVPLEDSELLDELHLMVDLVLASSVSDGPLSQRTIDRILGLDRSQEPGGPGGGA
jgi:hypothetical protein